MLQLFESLYVEKSDFLNCRLSGGSSCGKIFFALAVEAAR